MKKHLLTTKGTKEHKGERLLTFASFVVKPIKKCAIPVKGQGVITHPEDFPLYFTNS